MPVIPQYQAQLSPRAGVPDTPTAKAFPVGRLVSGLFGDAEDYLAKKADEDGRIWAAKSTAELRSAYRTKLNEAVNSGEDLDGYTPKLTQELGGEIEKLRKSAPNERAGLYLDLASPGIAAEVGDAATVAEANFRNVRRVRDISATFDFNRNEVTNDPSQFAKLYAEGKFLLDSVELPAAAKADLSKNLQGLAESALRGMKPEEALGQINEGAWNKYLDPDRRHVLVNGFEADIRSRVAQAKADQNLARAEKIQEFNYWMKANETSIATTGVPVPLPDSLSNEDLSFLKPQEIDRLRHGQERATMLFKATAEMKTQTPAEMYAAVEKLKPPPGAEGYDQKWAVYQAAEQKRANILAERIKDPALAARESFPALAATWQKYEDTQEPADLQAAMRQTRAAQTAMGIPQVAQKLLPVDFAKMVSGNIVNAQPEKAYQQMQAWARNFGPLWGDALRQMGPSMPAAYKIAATMDDDVDASLLIQTSRQAGDGGKSLETLRKTVGVAPSDLVPLSTDAAFEDLRRAFGPQGQAVAGDTLLSLETLALGRMLSFGEEKGAAMNSAIESIITDQYTFGQFNGKPFAIVGDTYRARASEIEDAASVAVDIASKLELDPPGLQSGASIPAQRAMYASAVKRNGYWVTNPGATGVTLYSERGVPVTVKGKPISYTWDQLLQVGTSAPKPPGPALAPGGYKMPKAGGSGGPLPSREEQRAIREEDEQSSFRGPPPSPGVEADVDNIDAIARGNPGPTASLAPNMVTTDTPQSRLSAEVVALGKRGFKGPIPRWLEDIETARKQGNYATASIDEKYREKIVALQEAIYQADKADKKTPIYKLAMSLGIVSDQPPKRQ